MFGFENGRKLIMFRPQSQPRIQRVRAILLTNNDTVLFIKRVKPAKPAYWVAPGGGVENYDDNLEHALRRELFEELGASVDILEHAFTLHHIKAGKNLEEHFYVCRLQHYDLSLRHGPEFGDPTRGQYIPDEIPLMPEALDRIDIKTPELRDWLLANISVLRRIA